MLLSALSISKTYAGVRALRGAKSNARRMRVLGFPVSPEEETQICNIEAALSFDPGPAAVNATLRIATPSSSTADEMSWKFCAVA